MYIIELVRDSQVIEQTECKTVEAALDELSRPLINRYRTRLQPPDKTGYFTEDEVRYARQCRELGLNNPPSWNDD